MAVAKKKKGFVQSDSTSAPTRETEKAFFAYPDAVVQSRQIGEPATRYLSPDYRIVVESTAEAPTPRVLHIDVQPKNVLFEIKNRSDVPVFSQLEFDPEARQHQDALEDVEELLRSVFGPDASLRFEEDWNEDYDRVESVLQMQVPYGREDYTLEELFKRYREFVKRYVATIPAETRSRFILEPHPIEK